jgi:hypothetical protein
MNRQKIQWVGKRQMLELKHREELENGYKRGNSIDG